MSITEILLAEQMGDWNAVVDGARTGAAWDPDEHPRDDEGQFTESGGEDRSPSEFAGVAVRAEGWSEREVERTDDARDMWAKLHADDGVPFPSGAKGEELLAALPGEDVEVYRMIQSNGNEVRVEFINGLVNYTHIPDMPFIRGEGKIAALDAIRALAEQHPAPTPVDIAFVRSEPGSATTLRYPDGTLTLMSFAEHDLQYPTASLNSVADRGWHPAVPHTVTALEYTIAHEWGHAVDTGEPMPEYVSNYSEMYNPVGGNIASGTRAPNASEERLRSERFAEQFAADYVSGR